MRVLNPVIAFAIVGWVLMTSPGATQERSVAEIKAEIFALAESFKGQADPDFSRQKQLDVLVDELLDAAPQPPVTDRLDLLYGPWKQVWGPYDYRGDDRGIDPDLAVDEIYQVVFPGGYYYNVTPLQEGRDPGKLRVALLRGKYRPVEGQPDMLRVRFTRFPGNRGRPADIPLWELPALAEKGELPNKISIVPGFIVWLFFGGGGLREVYTDEDLRITYGADSIKDRSDEAIYILRRVEEP